MGYRACMQTIGTAVAAAMLGVGASTLRTWRTRGIGPAYALVAGRVVYDAAVIAAYVHEPRKRGRKKGGKNRPKPEHVAVP